MDLSEPVSVVNTPPGLDLPTYVIFRLIRWSVYRRWMRSPRRANLGPKHVRSWYGPLILDPNVQRTAAPIIAGQGEECPVDIAEALETEKCVFALPDALKEVMIQEYILGGTQQEKAAALNPPVDRVTFWRRCQRAHTLLLGLMNDAAAGLLDD